MDQFRVDVCIYEGDPAVYVQRLAAEMLGTTELDLTDIIYMEDPTRPGAVMASGVVRPVR